MDSLGAAATRMLGLLGAGFGMAAFIRNSVEAQRAVAQLNAVVKSTGGAAGVTVPQLSAMAGELQKVSTFSDEAIMGAQGLLLTFTKIKGETLQGATQAVLDLATAMGGDLRGAAIQVGKALQDPALGMTALRRSGVSFSEAQQKVIKDLFDTGRVAEAQRLILAELSKEFGGSAEAARNTLGGALTALKNAFSDVLEVSQDSSTGIVGALNTITDALPGLRTKFAEFFGGIELMMVDASVRFQKLLRLMGTEVKFSLGKGFHTIAPKGALTDAQLEAFRAEETRRIIGGNPAIVGGGGGGGAGGGDDETNARRRAREKDAAEQLALDKQIADLRLGILLDELRKVGALHAEILGGTAFGGMPSIAMPFEGLDKREKEQLKSLGVITDDANKNADKMQAAIWGAASQLATTLVSAMNIGGGGKGSNLGGAIGGTAGFAAGMYFTGGNPIGGAIGSLLGNIGGSLIGGLFDSNKKEVNANTQALRANTAALVLFAPSGFKTAGIRYDATRVQDLQRDLRIFATRGGARALATP